jgi:hypothetical protein
MQCDWLEDFFEADHPDLQHYYCCTILVIQLGAMVHESRSVRTSLPRLEFLFIISVALPASVSWLMVIFHRDRVLRSLRKDCVRPGFLGNNFYYKLGPFRYKNGPMFQWFALSLLGLSFVKILICSRH